MEGEGEEKRVGKEVERVEGSEVERAKFKIYEHVVVAVVVVVVASSSLRLLYKIDPTSLLLPAK